MTQTVTNELMLELLKKIQADVAHMRGSYDEQLIAIREQIHNLQGDLLRLDRNVMHRLDRIERRLDLADAE
ncbi:MAG TPA: hypothetical protein VI756_02905 [Blastocatellia bacterium]